MACSKYFSTKETTHAARVSRLIVDPCTDLFRDILRNNVTEVQFPFVLAREKSVLSRILNKDQKEILYPSTGQYQGSYEEFDLSLLYTLLRNISGIAPHKKGWGKPPDPSDRSLSANIDRIRGIRNAYCGHTGKVFLSDGRFHVVWQDLTIIIGELEKSVHVGCSNYTDAAKLLETDTMDPEQEERYLCIIDAQKKTIEEIKEEVDRTSKELKELSIEFREGQKTQERHTAVIDDIDSRQRKLEEHVERLDTEGVNVLGSLDKERLLLKFWNWFTKRYKNVKVVRLYVGEEMIGTLRSKIKVIVLVIDDFKFIEEKVFDHSGNSFPVICKLFKFPPLEGAKVTSLEQDTDVDETLYFILKKCMRDISRRLFEKHSNLEIISASNFRSTKDGDELVPEPCIVFYCSCKRVIPLDESEFPTTVNGINTDVREGFFYQFPNEENFTNATEVLNPLMMGASISSKDFSKGGTLGGFVTLKDGNIGFITCAHVLFDLSRDCRETEHFEVVQPAYSYRNTNNICGVHILSCFPQTPFPDCTLDVSLVRLTTRIPEKGLFSNISAEDLSCLKNGYNMENLPEYSDDAIRDYREDHFAHLRDPCFKWGAKTGFTRGALRYVTSVRCFTDEIDVSHLSPPYKIKYHSQMEILGTGTSFCLPGDSGALVFQLDLPTTKDDKHRLRCIGMIVGATSDFKTVVTPIGPILETLDVKMHTFPQVEVDESSEYNIHVRYNLKNK